MLTIAINKTIETVHFCRKNFYFCQLVKSEVKLNVSLLFLANCKGVNRMRVSSVGTGGADSGDGGLMVMVVMMVVYTETDQQNCCQNERVVRERRW